MQHKVILHTGTSEMGNTPVLALQLQSLSEQYSKWFLISGRFPNRAQRRRTDAMTALNHRKQPVMNNRSITPGRKQYRLARWYNALVSSKAMANLRAAGSSLSKIFR